MAQIFEYLKMAFENIRANKGRSILTMLGIIIGIASVILIISIGNGASAQIREEMEGIGGGQIYVYCENNEVDYYITKDDMEAIIEKVDHVKGVTNQETYSGTVLGKKGDFEAYVTCGTQNLKYCSGLDILHGKYFSEEDYENAKKVCVIGENDAIRIFGTTDVIGMSLEVTIYNNSTELTIVGVTKASENSFLLVEGTDSPISIEMPSSTLYSICGFGKEMYRSIYVIGESGIYSKEIASSVLRLLKARHHVEEEGIFQVEDFNDYVKQIDSVMGTITTFIVLVAAISLLVGGIGVMNIMLVSVTERTREIGIRKALGARTGSVMMQFLLESAIITLVGGIIGIILGVLGAYGVCSLPIIEFKPSVSLATVIIATLFSSGVGLFFGIYPARKAAKLSPIEALRRN